MIADAPTRHRDAAVTRLITGGVLTDPAWRAALRDLPRDRFVTSFFTQNRTVAGGSGWSRCAPGPPQAPVGRVVVDAGWLRAVHDADALVVALSDLDAWGRQHPVWVSPPLAAVVTMLQTLAPRSGHRVLELGTGVGHTAALLGHRLGGASVTTVEIDPDLHRHAAVRLGAAGVHPTLVLGDSAEHCDPFGYDRVLVARHVDHVPPAWVGVVRPGGALLVGLRGSLGAGHHALLHHQINTATGAAELTGSFLDWTTTLPEHRRPARFRAVRRPLDPLPGPVRSGTTGLPVEQLCRYTPLTLLCQIHLRPGTVHAVRADATSEQSSYLHSPDGSWVEINHTLNRNGRHDLRWAEVTALPRLLEIALTVHHDLGAPEWSNLGLTATTAGTRLWHRSTGTSWPLPATEALPAL